MLEYDSSPSCGSEIAGIRGSSLVEKARNPSQPFAHVSRAARTLVACASLIVYMRQSTEVPPTPASIGAALTPASLSPWRFVSEGPPLGPMGSQDPAEAPAAKRGQIHQGPVQPCGGGCERRGPSAAEDPAAVLCRLPSRGRISRSRGRIGLSSRTLSKSTADGWLGDRAETSTDPFWRVRRNRGQRTQLLQFLCRVSSGMFCRKIAPMSR
eukprot:CAMPEP_0194283294 /NCGR_PEP_ID=MMETSP0169-20130528/25051_1 /TAXON_ID=218684 /ORGANISM="Corethron pennatum, Strain L29A3" /LENGTH=210 /DNA_ID=CAMNT_0039028861 /DNA_START=638 /DNA_END=1271 /DNA_ORIENTATION=+